MKYIKQFESKYGGEETPELDKYIYDFLAKKFEPVVIPEVGDWTWEKNEYHTSGNKYTFDIKIIPHYKSIQGLFNIVAKVNESEVEKFVENLTVDMMDELGIFNSVEYKPLGTLKDPKIGHGSNDIKDEWRITCELKEGLMRGFKTNLMSYQNKNKE